MAATLHAIREPAGAAANPNISGSALAYAFIPEADSPLLTDHALAVLARTAADWFAPSQAECLHVGAAHGRIRLAGHIQDARPLARLKTALLGLRNVSGLDVMITVDSACLSHLQAG